VLPHNKIRSLEAERGEYHFNMRKAALSGIIWSDQGPHKPADR